MLTCLCDSAYGEVGVATVKALEYAGCEVSFNPAQTCCGQPPFNAGDWNAARPIAVRTIANFKLMEPDALPVVAPSASCVAMVRHGYGMLDHPVSREKIYELCEFIVDVLKVEEWPGKVKPMNVALHKACHHRMAGLADQQERLLASIEGVRTVRVEDSEQCCGFGGAFSVSHPKTSEGIGLEKIRQLTMSGADVVASSDMGCIAHLDGLAKKNGIEIRFVHLAQILAEAIEK